MNGTEITTELKCPRCKETIVMVPGHITKEATITIMLAMDLIRMTAKHCWECKQDAQ